MSPELRGIEIQLYMHAKLPGLSSRHETTFIHLLKSKDCIDWLNGV